ncbi:MAG TPA: DNA-directed RNA polymerase subunit omega [Acidimicrobiales bacterium]|nr:DNA-directed RNA polymerase subunit omega [Acidimicrobiales bacterium]
MASRQDTMMNPSIEELLDRAGSKFSLVTLSAMRARQINAYFNQLGEGLGAIVPPQVTSVARKPLSIAFEEIAGDKIVLVHPTETAGEDTDEAGAEGLEAVAGTDVGAAEPQTGEGGESDGSA